MAFITTVLFIPCYILLIWSYLHPEENLLSGNRWMFDEEPEFSDKAIFYTKASSIAGMIFLTMILFDIYFSNRLLSISMFFAFFIYIGVQFYRFYKLFLE